MQIKNPKKTVKFLYLYLTVPLLLIALVMGVMTWGMMSAEVSEKGEEPAAAKEESVDPSRWGHKECESKDDCRIGESCLDNFCVNLLRERRAAEAREAKKKSSGGMGASGWAAIITAIMGGLTGLMGAVTQTIVAFARARERRARR